MNNARLVLESPALEENTEDITPKLRSEEARLVKIIEALYGIQESREWSTLKIEVLDNLVNILVKDVQTEARKEEPSPQRLNRLSGELKWAERYADLSKLENYYRSQLKNIRTKLYDKEE